MAFVVERSDCEGQSSWASSSRSGPGGKPDPDLGPHGKPGAEEHQIATSAYGAYR